MGLEELTFYFHSQTAHSFYTETVKRIIIFALILEIASRVLFTVKKNFAFSFSYNKAFNACNFNPVMVILPVN